MQNKYKHLHFLVCLGSGLRKASADITRDELPEQMQNQLKRLARANDEPAKGTSGKTKTCRQD